jgi:hypothetical protein
MSMACMLLIREVKAQSMANEKGNRRIRSGMTENNYENVDFKIRK